MNNLNYKPWLHRITLGLLFSVFFLVFAGGLVTSHQAGLSVPDWPLSYGQFVPPMVGGVFYEAGHRLVAETVGFFTLILAFLYHFKEKRSWLRKAAWSALGLVIVQGILGGMTVLLLQPALVSIAHACTAQAFLSLIVCLSMWSSKFWESNTVVRTEEPSKVPLHQISLLLFGTCYAQLIFGAILRHTGKGVLLHIAGALVLFFLSTWVFSKTRNTSSKALKLFSTFQFTAFLIQTTLGLSSYFILRHSFDVIPRPEWATSVITAHVVTGALVLGLSVSLVLISFKTKPQDGDPQSTKSKMADYYELTKPGISFMAAVTALAGFVLGSEGKVDLPLLIHTTIGTLLVAGAAGTLNMLLEKDIDAKMKRTMTRPLPSGRMNAGEALLAGCLLMVGGLLYLASAVNILTAIVAGLTLSTYLYIYTPLKKVSGLCTTFGAVAGALPPVIGWAAATGKLGLGGWILFGILFFWQFPHFFSLAWLYKDDYAQAGLYMLPRVQDDGTITAFSTLLNSVLLLAVSVLPTTFGYTGKIYFVTAALLGGWLVVTSAMFINNHSRTIARHIFIASILYVPVLVTVMILNSTSLWK